MSFRFLPLKPHLRLYMIKTRIAPTPSGLLHRGNAYNFLLTAFIASQKKGTLRLRIDDLDAPRMRREYLEDIFETLSWLNIKWQSGPESTTAHLAGYKQEYRLPRYHELLDKLVATDQIFACTCSRKDILQESRDGQYPGTCRFKNLPLNTPDAAWRLITPESSVIQFEDALMGKISIDLHLQARDLVIRRRDGLPAYHLASLTDDADFGINTIVRGDDLLLSTGVQLYLAEKLFLPVFKEIRFYHHPLIKDSTGEKLSKSAGSASIKFLRESGKSSATFLEKFTDWKDLLGAIPIV